MDDIPVAPLHDSPRLRSAAAAGQTGKPGGHAPVPPNSRRGFFYHLFTALIGGLVAVVPLAAGLAVYLDPLRRKSAAGKMIPITTLDALPDASAGDALIGRFSVIADRVDAWNIFPNEPIGGVYLIVPQGTSTVKALHATCPHLGCGVDIREEADGKFSFKCPCHTSAFTSNGGRVMPCVSPRDMDELPCEVRTVDGRREILVEFANYQPGLAEKKAKT